MRRKNIKHLVTLLLPLYLLCGCNSQKQIAYLQNISQNNYEYDISNRLDIKIQPNDMLSILVNCKDVELAQIFNLPVVSYRYSAKGAAEGGSGVEGILGYLVNEDGTIDFPQLGTIHVAGMTRSELTTYIKDQLSHNGLMKDPIVTIQFLNFKVSVLGEVDRPGTFNVGSERITLFDALSQAGDLTIYGRRDNIKVIREKNGKCIIGSIDLRSDSILKSPYYYLQQNDVVYVEPNKAKSGQREINQNTNISTFASILSIIVTIAVLIFK